MIGELVTIVVDTACVLIAFGTGARLANRRHREPKPKPVNLRCGCDHVLAYHDPKTGVCHATDKVGRRVPRKNKSGADMADTLYVEDIVPCTCQVYTGDLPPDWYARTWTGEAA